MNKFWRFFLSAISIVLIVAHLHALPSAIAQNTTEAATLILQGKQNYERGQFVAAITPITEAAKIYRATGRNLERIQTLSLLSLVYERLGRWGQAEKTIDLCFSLLSKIPDSQDRDRVYAQVLNRQGRWQLARGDAKAALSSATQATSLYSEDSTAKIGSQINQARAWQVLGYDRRVEKVLALVEKELASQEPSAITVKGLHNLGNFLRRKGELKRATIILEQSYELAKRLHLDRQKTDILMTLGNLQHSLARDAARKNEISQATSYLEKALGIYQQVERDAIFFTTKIKARLNQIELFIATDRLSLASNSIDAIANNLEQLIPSRESVYIHVRFVRDLLQLESDLDIVSIANKAIQQAEELQDSRAISEALGTLGRVYEVRGESVEARKNTESALLIAHQINAFDLTYRWQWQLGRLLTKKQALKPAIAAYTAAVSDLQLLRNDLAIDPDLEFSFREEVEPVYRELVDLLLREQHSSPKNTQNLQQALRVLESLQLVELENFFHSPCLKTKVEIERVIESENSQTAVVYPVVLPDRLEIIVKFPRANQLRQYTVPIAGTEVEDTLAKLQNYLPDVTRAAKVNELSRQAYQWLIGPIEKDLTTDKVTTLVFVLDGTLRNIPLGILYDTKQEQYLIEKYAIAIAPGLQLVEFKPRKEISLNTLIAGVERSRSLEGKDFSALTYVPSELENIAKQTPRSKFLVNEQFTLNNLRQQLESNNFSVVHLATHGEFSSDLEETFILTWNKLLKIEDFVFLLRNSDYKTQQDIELLVLSACQTATGDKQASLGLAGIAVQAGARSTVATLWSVDDRATTDIMSQFYRELNQNTTKAEALQKAQLKILAKEKRPYFWAGYVLIGNWL